MSRSTQNKCTVKVVEPPVAVDGVRCVHHITSYMIHSVLICPWKLRLGAKLCQCSSQNYSYELQVLCENLPLHSLSSVSVLFSPSISVSRKQRGGI